MSRSILRMYPHSFVSETALTGRLDVNFRAASPTESGTSPLETLPPGLGLNAAVVP